MSTPALATTSRPRVEAPCKRCGRVRAINEARSTPLCVDCRIVERLTAAPRPADGLGRGQWQRHGLTVVWKPAVQPSARRCVDCGAPTVDQHRATERCRDCWRSAVKLRAQRRALEREARKLARAAERAARNARKRAASTLRCQDCDATLTTRHRTVRRCRACWKAAVQAAAELRMAERRARTPALPEAPAGARRPAPVFCEHDGCLLAHPGESCPACEVAAQAHLTAEAA